MRPPSNPQPDRPPEQVYNFFLPLMHVGYMEEKTGAPAEPVEEEVVEPAEAPVEEEDEKETV